jgi:hypothetical protein
MSVSEAELEERAVTPRVTLEEVERSILFCHFFTAAEGIRAGSPYLGDSRFEGKMQSLEQLTFCVLTLKNGFTVVGKSACTSPANYQKDIGERIAKANAVSKIWELLGFRLCDKISAGVV